MPKTFEEFMRGARLLGMSDAELAVFVDLYRAAVTWSDTMEHCRGANNYNGALHRAVAKAREAFGEPRSLSIGSHEFCLDDCVAWSGAIGPCPTGKKYQRRGSPHPR